MRISDSRELCDFVSMHAAEFNHVKCGHSFRQVLKKPLGIPPKSLEQAFQSLEGSAPIIRSADLVPNVTKLPTS
jgi:hypothetical protein